jgi:hypothetical protein
MDTSVSISLNNIQNIKTVNIEGIGVVKVRRLGAGEDLDLSVKVRRLGKLIDELSAIDFTKYDAKKPEDLKEIEKLTKRAEAISDEVAEIKRFEFETYKRCFSDDKDGALVDVIMNTLTEAERAELFKQIFNEKKQIEAPKTVLADESEETEENTNV